jgi:hypothetical protein
VEGRHTNNAQKKLHRNLGRRNDASDIGTGIFPGKLEDCGQNRLCSHKRGRDGSGISTARLAILPGLTHYNIFSSPLLASTVASFFDAQSRTAK